MDGDAGERVSLRGKGRRQCGPDRETAGIPVGELLWANQIEYPYRLAVGQSLLVPEGPAADREQSRRELYSFGYAYPFNFKGDGGADSFRF